MRNCLQSTQYLSALPAFSVEVERPWHGNKTQPGIDALKNDASVIFHSLDA